MCIECRDARAKTKGQPPPLGGSAPAGSTASRSPGPMALPPGIPQGFALGLRPHPLMCPQRGQSMAPNSRLSRGKSNFQACGSIPLLSEGVHVSSIMCYDNYRPGGEKDIRCASNAVP